MDPMACEGLRGHAGNFKAGSSHRSATPAVGMRAALRKRRRFVLSSSQTKEAEKTGSEAFTNDCSFKICARFDQQDYVQFKYISAVLFGGC